MGPVRKTQPLGSRTLKPHHTTSPITGKSTTSSSQPETEGLHPAGKIPPLGTISKVQEASSVSPGVLEGPVSLS